MLIGITIGRGDVRLKYKEVPAVSKSRNDLLLSHGENYKIAMPA